MLMQGWRKSSALHRWMVDRRVARAVRALGIACAAYSIAIVVMILVDDDGDAPLPWRKGNFEAGEFFLALAVMVLLGLAAGLLESIRMRRAMRRPISRSV